jgi:hypothetical protein
MTRSLTASTTLAAALAAGLLAASAQAAPSKAMSGKMVPLYQADKCHMYYTPAQAKKYGYACPDSKGKMKPVKVTPAVAKAELAKTNAALTPKKAL